MNRLEQTLQAIKRRETIGLMTHVVVGYPSLDDTIRIVETMADNGADIVELQIPFSDPLADGPTIMRACETSLKNGTKVKDAFATMRKLSSNVEIPLLFMAYYNTVFHYGVEAFCRDAAEAGASGLIVPDMPLDEEPMEHFFAACKKHRLHTIQVLSPASNDERLQKNAEVANGFVYCTSRQGTTGAHQELAPDLAAYLQKMRQNFSLPLAVGFGISKREHLEILAPHADIAVIGSALIDVIQKSDSKDIEKSVTTFLTSLRRPGS